MSTSGVVARLLVDKGFGFIRRADGVEYFFHRSAVQDGPFEELYEGQTVTFDEGNGTKGPRAERVRIA